jgi:hypothetical protein
MWELKIYFSRSEIYIFFKTWNMRTENIFFKIWNNNSSRRECENWNIFFKMRISDLKSCSPKYIFQDLKYIFFQDVKCENWNIFFKIWNVRISDLKIADLRSEIYFSRREMWESQIWNVRISDLKCENLRSENLRSDIYISSRREMWESQIWNIFFKSRIADLKYIFQI